MMNFLQILVMCNSVIYVCSIFTNVINTDKGRLRGLRSIFGQNRYYGITYAVSERFQPPQDPPPWPGVYFALRRFTTCAQSVSILTMGTEDCLQLDVYTPETAHPGDKIPVMMFIHGGGYYYGSKFHYDPEFMVSKNIISVIINYRVGVLGFLCVGEVANLGLKDQTAALRWIKRNIAAFGGDPDNVTIMGQSAGASAAAMHLLSHTSKGLFHKLMLLSGSALTPWAFNAEPLKAAFEDALKLFPVEHAEDVVNVFKEAALSELLRATHDVSTNTRYFKYSPCIDANNTEPFFYDLPHNTLASGNFNKVPIIIGHTNAEGILFNGLHNDESRKDFIKTLTEKLPSVFSHCSDDVKISVAEELRSFYFSSIEDNTKGFIDFYSDWIAYSSTYAFSSLISEVTDAPVYNYIFSYEGDRNFAKFILGASSKSLGASHSDDIFYIFKPAGISFILSKRDRLLIDKLTKMLVMFMWTSNPTPRISKTIPVIWPRFTRNTSLAMNIGNKLTSSFLSDLYRGRRFYDILCTYGKKGYVPCEGKGFCE